MRREREERRRRVRPLLLLCASTAAVVSGGAHGSLRGAPILAQARSGGPAAPQAAATRSALEVTVLDENGKAVADASVKLLESVSQREFSTRTDYAGRSQFRNLAPGSYRLRVEREGFYEVNKEGVQIRGEQTLEVTMNHQQEYFE
ncbi:MAG: hypothetical protein DMG21_20090, partial [Acidobacteria bacterium]